MSNTHAKQTKYSRKRQTFCWPAWNLGGRSWYETRLAKAQTPQTTPTRPVRRRVDALMIIQNENSVSRTYRKEQVATWFWYGRSFIVGCLKRMCVCLCVCVFVCACSLITLLCENAAVRVMCENASKRRTHHGVYVFFKFRKYGILQYVLSR